MLSYQSDDLSCLSNDLKVFEALEDQGDVEGADGHHVNYIHGVFQEPDARAFQWRYFIKIQEISIYWKGIHNLTQKLTWWKSKFCAVLMWQFNFWDNLTLMSITRHCIPILNKSHIPPIYIPYIPHIFYIIVPSHLCQSLRKSVWCRKGSKFELQQKQARVCFDLTLICSGRQ